MAQTRVTYTRNPDSKRALGLPLEWYWEEHDKFYMGVGLETYRDEDGIPCTRAVWIDGRVREIEHARLRISV